MRAAIFYDYIKLLMRTLACLLVLLLATNISSQISGSGVPSTASSSGSAGPKTTLSSVSTKPNQAGSSASSSSPSNNDKTPQFIRLRDIQKKGQSFSDLLSRLTTTLALTRKGKPSTVPGARRLLVDDAVQTLIDSFHTSTTIANYNTPTQIATGNTTGLNCTYQGMSYSQPTNSFLNIDNTYINLFPGSVLQSKFINGVQMGTDSQVPVPASNIMKNPTIKIYDQLNVDTYSLNYDMGSISKAISGAIEKSINATSDNKIYFEIGTSDDIADFAQRLNFNTNTQRKLGLYRQPGTPLTGINKKIILFFTKPIGTFETVIESADHSDSNTPLNTFFTPLLTQAEANKRTPSWWGPANPPIYIDSVVYGSMITMTVDVDAVTNPLYDELTSQTATGLSQQVLNKIVAHKSLKVISVGPFSSIELTALKSANWTSFLFTVPNTASNTAINQMIHPLIYTIKDFNQNRYNSANAIEYVKICSAPYPQNAQNYPNIPSNHTVLVAVGQVLPYAPVSIILYNSNVMLLSQTFSQSGSYNLSSYLSYPTLTVAVRATAGKQSSTSPSQQQVKVSFIVDGVTLEKGEMSCSGSMCYDYDAGTFILDTTTFTVTP